MNCQTNILKDGPLTHERLRFVLREAGANYMDISLEMNAEQTLKVSPTLIAVNQILALSSQELQAAIKQEAEENPALEITERHTCAICGEVLNHGVCANCSRRGQSQEARPAPGEDYGRGLL